MKDRVDKSMEIVTHIAGGEYLFYFLFSNYNRFYLLIMAASEPPASAFNNSIPSFLSSNSFRQSSTWFNFSFFSSFTEVKNLFII